MKFRHLKQTAKTTKFIADVKRLVDKGSVKNLTEIINALDWEKTMFSNVLNGRRNVPNDKYLKFTEVYKSDLASNGLQHKEVPLVKTAEAGEEISKLIRDMITVQAKLNILLVTVESIAADQKGKAVALVSGQMKQAIEMEDARLFQEYIKQS